MNQEYRIFITGGAGTLGSNIIEHLLPKGIQLLTIDNFATGHKESLPKGFDNLKVVEGSVLDQSLLEELVSEFKPTHIIHSAAAYKDPDNWVEDAKTNILGSINIAKIAEKYSISQIINFQTALCYGDPDEVPIPVNAPLRPKTSYAVSKVSGESYMMQSTVPVVSLRLSNVTSPRLSIGPIPTFYSRLKNKQNCFCSDTVRDFLDISDFLNLIDLVLEKPQISGIFNVSTGKGRTMKDIFETVVKWLDIKLVDEVAVVAPGPDDVPAVVLDPIETIEKFGWKPQVDFTKTIENMLSWYDANGINNIYSHLKAPSKD